MAPQMTLMSQFFSLLSQYAAIDPFSSSPEDKITTQEITKNLQTSNENIDMIAHSKENGITYCHIRIKRTGDLFFNQEIIDKTRALLNDWLSEDRPIRFTLCKKIEIPDRDCESIDEKVARLFEFCLKTFYQLNFSMIPTKWVEGKMANGVLEKTYFLTIEIQKSK